MKSQPIRQLEGLLNRVLPSKGTLESVENIQNIGPGQMWSTKAILDYPIHFGEHELFWVLVVQSRVMTLNKERVHLVAPLLSDPHLAGPEDIILPKEIMGHRVALAWGSRITVLEKSLDRCEGKLPKKWCDVVAQLSANVDFHVLRTSGIEMGFDYLDNHDIRFAYHENLVDRLSYLQSPVIQVVWHEQADVIRMDKWFSRIERAKCQSLAAATGSAFEESLYYRVVGKKLVIKVVLASDWTHVQLLILNEKGELAPELDGCQVVNTEGKAVGKPINDAQVLIDLNEMRWGWSLVDKDETSRKIEYLPSP